MSTFLTGTIDTPDGLFTVIERANGVVIAAGWDADTDQLFARARLDVEPHFVAGARSLDAVRQYYAGNLHAVQRVPVAQSGTPLQEAVWQHLRKIEPGQTETYSEVAVKLGQPRAFRAVANSCARNAVGLFVPCHRVMPASGKITGFAWGPHVKASLLERESA